LLENPECTKLFHFARFDVAAIQHWLGVTCTPIWCTKIASKLARTFSDRHGLKDLCKELLSIDISKQQQISDWGSKDLTPDQLTYAANDVLHLHRLKEKLHAVLIRENRFASAQACFEFLPHLTALDRQGWGSDVFAH
jgi:ribonuclease D